MYPLIGLFYVRSISEIAAFGVSPCSVVIFTAGLLLLTISKVPLLLLFIPTLWSLIGGSAAFLLDVPQDWALLFAGPITSTWTLIRDRSRFRHTRTA
jgi:hypothetical protein